MHRKSYFVDNLAYLFENSCKLKSYSELGRMLGLTASGIHRVRQSEIPSIAVLIGLSDYFKIKIDDLLFVDLALNPLLTYP